MLYLQSKSKYAAIMVLDPNTGAYQQAVRGELPSNVKVNGVFDFLDSALVALYLYAGNMFLRVGETVIPLIPGVKISVGGGASERRFNVTYGDGESLNLKYSVAGMPKDDPTPFIESEDFDFGLFVSNVFSDPSRRNVLKSVWSTDACP